jgi:hypothetical protein
VQIDYQILRLRRRYCCCRRPRLKMKSTGVQVGLDYSECERAES